MTPRLAKLHEAERGHSSKVAATFFKHPEIFKYARDGKWLCEICKTGAMTIKKARAHEIRCQEVGAAENEEARSLHENLGKPHRSEGDDSTTSTHQEGTVFEDGEEDDNEDDDEGESDDDDDDDDYDDDNDNEGNENDNNDTAFVENFLRSQDVAESHRKKMRSFYKMPTNQKIQKIREVIDAIRDLCGQ